MNGYLTAEQTIGVFFMFGFIGLFIYFAITDHIETKRMTKQRKEIINKTKWSEKKGWKADFQYGGRNEWDDVFEIIVVKNYKERKSVTLKLTKYREGKVELKQLKK